jgi:phage terminase large subunit
MSTATETKKLNWGDFIDPDKRYLGKYYPLHDAQQIVYNSNARFTAAIAGTGGGKTVLGPLWVAKQLTRVSASGSQKPALGLVVAPTYKVLIRATVPTLIDTLYGTVFEGTYKDSKNLYVIPPNPDGLPNGGRIWCQGADNPGGIEGGQFDFVWGDEAGQFKLSVWNAIQGRTGQKQSPVLFTTTPYGRNWLYTEFYKRWKEGDRNYFVKQWASYLNPTYAREEYERAKKTMGKERAAQRYDGLFLQPEGLVYPEMDTCLVELPQDQLLEKLKDAKKHYGGIDFGWNDPFCALAGFIDKQDILWVWYERYKTRTPIEDHAEAMPNLYGKTIKWFSEHQPELILKLRKGGHKVKKATKNIKAGIDAVNARIYQGKLKILVNRCLAVVAEAANYSYTDDEDDPGNDIPIDENNHAMDALRYLVMGIDGRKAA